MLTKILNIEVPPIYGYLHHAYHLSVAQRHPQFYKWFYCNYIQLEYNPTTDWLNFYSLDIKKNYYPLLNVEVLSNTTIKINKVDILDFIINCVNNNRYIWLYTDEFYDPNKTSFNTKHFVHESLIYGYDLNNRCFYSVGFNNKYLYATSIINFEDFVIAYNSVETHFEIRTFKPDTNVSYEFDLINVKGLMEDYVYSNNSSLRNRMFGCNNNSDIIYGIEIYKYLKMNFENPISSDYLNDIRPLHILSEHKKTMVSRIKFLYENKYIDSPETIINEFIDIEDKVLLLRNIQIKYIITGKIELIQKIVKSFNELYIQETQAYTDLINRI